MAEDPLYASFHNIDRVEESPRDESTTTSDAMNLSSNLETSGIPVATEQYVRLEDNTQEPTIDFAQEQRDIHEQTVELPFAVRGMVRMLGNKALQEAQAEQEKDRVAPTERL